MPHQKAAEFKPFEETKVWGHVTHIFSDHNAAVSYLRVEADSWCSKHKHEFGANQFFIVKGSILIEIYEEDALDEPYEVVTLNERDVFTVPSGIWHRFRVLEPGNLIEVYWSDTPESVCSIDDIVRHDIGGKL